MSEQKLEALVVAARSALATQRKATRLSARIAKASHKQAASLTEDANDEFRQLSRDMHELHCLAVELGLAEAEPHRYGEKRVPLGWGRDVLEVFRAPESAPNYDYASYEGGEPESWRNQAGNL